MDQICERCKKEFKCGRKNGASEKCWCFDLPPIQLPENNYRDCLCRECLTALESPIKAELQQEFSPALKEGADFYFENGLMVLTEAYLKRRGFCCENRCRHCPY